MDVTAEMGTGTTWETADAGSTVGNASLGTTDGAAGTASFRSSWDKSLAAMKAMTDGTGVNGETSNGAVLRNSEGAKSQSEILKPDLSEVTPKVLREKSAAAEKVFALKNATAEEKNMSGVSVGARTKRTRNSGFDANATVTVQASSAALTTVVPVTDPAGHGLPLLRNGADKEGIPDIAKGVFAQPARLGGEQNAFEDQGVLQAQEQRNETASSASGEGSSLIGSMPANGNDSIQAVQTDLNDKKNLNSNSEGSIAIGPRPALPDGEAPVSVRSGADRHEQVAMAQAERSFEPAGLQKGTRTQNFVRERVVSKTANATASGNGAGSWNLQHSPTFSSVDTNIQAVLNDGGIPFRVGDRIGMAHGTSTSDASTKNDAFAALDEARSPASASWIHAGAHHAEAGYLDPALGWIGVRADSVGGGVHAAVMPGSPEAAQALNSHIGSLNAYLAGRHEHPTTVTMDTPQSGQGSESNSGQGGSHGQAEQQNAEQGRATLTSKSMQLTASTTHAMREREVASPRMAPSASGAHISVLA